MIIALAAVLAMAGGGAVRAAGAGTPAGETAGLVPFTATYAVSYHGVEAGGSRFRLHEEADGRWLYESTSRASGLFRLFVGGEITQSSRFEVGPGGLRPLRFRSDDGSERGTRDASLDFDWARGRVTGSDEGRPVDLALQPGVFDVLSAQAALMWALAHGEQLTRYALPDPGGLQSYTVETEGPATLATPLGALPTLVVKTRRVGAKHWLRLWLAPSLGHAPVQVEQQRETKRVWIMRLTRFERDAAATRP